MIEIGVIECQGASSVADNNNDLVMHDHRRNECGAGLRDAHRRPLADQRQHNDCRPISAPAEGRR
jgi:hypothetical protein